MHTLIASRQADTDSASGVDLPEARDGSKRRSAEDENIKQLAEFLTQKVQEVEVGIAEKLTEAQKAFQAQAQKQLEENTEQIQTLKLGTGETLDQKMQLAFEQQAQTLERLVTTQTDTLRKEAEARHAERADLVQNLRQCTVKALKRQSDQMQQAYKEATQQEVANIKVELDQILTEHQNWSQQGIKKAILQLKEELKTQKEMELNNLRESMEKSVAKSAEEWHDEIEKLRNELATLKSEFKKSRQHQARQFQQVRQDITSLNEKIQMATRDQDERLKKVIRQQFDELVQKQEQTREEFMQAMAKLEEEHKTFARQQSEDVQVALKEEIQQVQQAIRDEAKKQDAFREMQENFFKEFFAARQSKCTKDTDDD